MYNAPIHNLFNYDFSFFFILYCISYYNTWHAFCIHISVTIFNILTKLDSRNVENKDKIVGFYHPDETPISISYIVCRYIHCNHIANITFHLLSICWLNIKRVEYKTILQHHIIWCDFRTISLAKSVTSYTEYLMYFFLCAEPGRLVSIFKKY